MSDSASRTSLRWERLIQACYPPSWRQDGRVHDMVVTALTAAEVQHRDGLGPYEVVDLVAFGVRMRFRELDEVMPTAARAVLAWGGLLSGLVLAVMVLDVPDRADPLGHGSFAHSWYAAYSVIWLVLAATVIYGRRSLIRLTSTALIVLAPLLMLFGAGYGLPAVRPYPLSDFGRYSLNPLVGGHPNLYLLLPLWLFALMTFDNRPLMSPPRWLTTALIASTALVATIYGRAWNGYLFYSTPPSAASGARDALALLAAVLVVLAVRSTRSAPAAALVAIPWVILASVTVQNPFGEKITITPWQIAAGALLALLAALTIWRRQTRPQ